MGLNRGAGPHDAAARFGKHGRIVVDFRAFDSAGLVAAAGKLMGMFAIILADAEDVAPGTWNRSEQADITKRDAGTTLTQPMPYRIVPGDQIEYIGDADRMDNAVGFDPSNLLAPKMFKRGESHDRLFPTKSCPTLRGSEG
jgi:hypothetical protein